MKNSLISLGTIALLTAGLCAQEKDILTTASDAGQFKTLAAAVKAAGLDGALSGKGPFTVFAPTDAAFAKLPKGTLEMLLKPENKGQLQDILKYHVVAGSYSAKKVVGTKSVPTLFGSGAVVISGESVQIGNATIVKTDIKATNGVIHVIDTVMLPPNIVEAAANAGQFNTLIAAAKAAGLAGALSNDGPFTVFAPTDAAFAKLPEGTLEMLLKPENKQKLADILKFHVVPGRVTAADAMKVKSAKTLLGQKVMLKKVENGLQINGANIIATDVMATNGVIHVIDAVILPN